MKKIMTFLILIYVGSLLSQVAFLQKQDKPIIFDNLDSMRDMEINERYVYEWQNDDWENLIQYLYFYESGLNSEIKVYYWNGSVWAYDHRELYSYDENDNIIEVIIQIHSGSWLNYLRYEVNWENEHVIEILIQNWINLAWENSERTLVSYDANENEIQDLYQTWDGYDWYDQELYTMTYDVANLRLDLLEQHNNQGSWIDYYLNTFTYDGNDNLIEDLGAYNYNGIWENEHLNSYEYNANNLHSYTLRQYYFMDEWWNEEQVFFTYDDSLLSDIFTQEWGTVWENLYLEEFFYEDVGISNEQLPMTDLQITNYPNPFNPSTTISFNVSNEQYELGIYNLKGQKVKTLPVILSPSTQLRTGLVEGSAIWNGTDDSDKVVSSGVYFARLKSNGKEIAVNKMLLLK